MSIKKPLESDRISLDDIAQILKATSEFGLSDTILVQTAIFQEVKNNNLWKNYATTLTLGSSIDNDTMIHLGKVLLITSSTKASSIQDGQHLQSLLTHWKTKTDTPEETEFHQTHQSSRYTTKYSWIRSDVPYWQIECSETTGTSTNIDPPKGPFFDLKTRFFAQDIHDAAQQWIPDFHIERETHHSNGYLIRIPDRRGYFLSQIQNEDTLSLDIAVKKGMSLYCCGQASDKNEIITRYFEPVKNGEVNLTLPQNFRNLSLYLMTEDGECLDQYQESEKQILPLDGTASNTERLLLALETGESQQIEFKKWLPPVRESKTDEWIKTAAAFTNASGGYFFIGITDDGEIEGTRIELQKQYASKYQGDFEAIQNAYVRDLRRLLSEAISPFDTPEFEWIENAGKHVLCIIFQPQEKPAVVIETGETYIRKNATNRKASITELEQSNRLDRYAMRRLGSFGGF